MCGILGVAGAAGTGVSLAEARRALSSIRHRGPDDEGYLLFDSTRGVVRPCGGADTDPCVGLPDLDEYAEERFDVVFGHRRLSIIDLSPRGHQPMASADGRYWIVFNGEIYNYLELRAELSGKRRDFQTKTDTEVVLAAYQEWGASMLNRFIGMFALAILDIRERRIFLGRDCFGIKPLYYSSVGSRFAFSSEIKALLGLQGVTRRADPQRLYEYLRFANTDHGDGTMFSDIRQLPAAHYIVWSLENGIPPKPARYWSVGLDHRRDIPFRDAVHTMRELVEESVRLHIRSDVPVGACLSGGLDSSSIVAFMRKVGGEGQEFHTFSYIEDHPTLGEEKFVDIVNADCSTVGHKVRVSPLEIVEDLDRLVHCQEQPFMSTSIYAQFRVFRLAHEAGIKVMLDGQGADEIFAGYYHLLGARITSLLSRGKIAAAWRIARCAPKNMRTHRWKMILSSIGRMLPPRVNAPLMAMVGQSLWPSWLIREWFVRGGVTARWQSRGHGKDSLREELLYSINELSLPNLLRYEDRNSMCHSIESRVPFCNPKLAEFALSLPGHYLVADNGITKAVFREAMRGMVPTPVLDREKIGFATPERVWLNSLRPWIDQTLSQIETTNVPFLRHEETRRMIASELRSKEGLSGYSWRCLNVIHWARVFSVSWN